MVVPSELAMEGCISATNMTLLLPFGWTETLAGRFSYRANVHLDGVMAALPGTAAAAAASLLYWFSHPLVH